jgi:uracil phosphoribosyltransferase
LGLSHGIADYVPNIFIGSVTLDHVSNSSRLEPRLHLANAPALNESRVILFDPIVASGISVGLALQLLRKSGATDLSLVSFVMSAPGLKRVQATMPDVMLWTAAVDEELDPKRGPLPGIGNLGERLYSNES